MPRVLLSPKIDFVFKKIFGITEKFIDDIGNL